MLFFMPSSSSSQSQSQHDFLESLENERRKIQMFSRELPLTLHLINREIDSLRTQNATSDAQLFNCIPDLLTSVNLNHTIADETPLDERGTLRKPVAVNARRVVCGAFQPFERNKLVTAPSVSSTTVMTVERRKDGEVVEKEEDEKKQTLVDSMGSNRKNRRCWSPDLHRKFLNALEVLGGSHVATPKQIREMMKVDSLTNDEVKSHLQKYRLHTKRPAAATAHNSIGTRTPPHFVLLGNIWAPPHEYASAATERTEGSVAALKETYSPAASLPLELRLQEEQSAKKQQRNRPSSGAVHPERMISQDDDSLLDDAATKSNSPSSSFSSQTTTVSPPL